jgi:hypothetical protein
MSRERAETHLRLLAEAELRRATTRPADGGLLDECHSARLELVAQALHAARVFDMGAANQIQDELALALGVRQPRRGPGGPAPNAQANLARLMLRPPHPGAAHHQPPSPHASWRVMPVGHVIRTRADDIQGELHLLAYAQTAVGGRFTAVSYWGPGQAPERHRPPPGVRLAHQFTAIDDQGTSYQFSASPGPVHTEWSGVLDLLPDPPPEIGWLDLRTTRGQPATRIDLGSQQSRTAPPPDITVTPAAVSPGELLLTDIAAGFLALAAPEQVPLHPSAARPGPLTQAGHGLADIIAALQAAAALPPSSRLPGQLAGLCVRLGIGGHGIATPPAGDLPGPWLNLLAYCRRGTPERAPVPGWAVTAIELPELDGARVAVLGLHNGEHGQFLHLLASGVTPEYTWPYGTITNCPARPVAPRTQRPLAHRPPGTIGPAPRYQRLPALAQGRAAAGPGHPMDRRGGHRAIGRALGQAAAQLETQSARLLKLLPDAAPNQRICMLPYALLTTDRRPDLPMRGSCVPVYSCADPHIALTATAIVNLGP